MKHAQNLLFINAVCATYFSVSSKHLAFRIMFRKFRHFYVNSVHKTWQMAIRARVRYLYISTKIYHKQVKFFIFTRLCMYLII